MSPPKKKAKFRNVSRKGKTFDGYEKEFLPMFSFDNLKDGVKEFADYIANKVTGK
jgi:hypothetical protein